MTFTWQRGVAAALALGLTACAATPNPVSGEREFTTLSSAQEQKIGDAEHPKLLKQFGGAYTSHQAAGYVAELGNRLAAQSHLAGQQRFTFTVLDTPTVNAFAVPGGYVYITRGLMALAQDEAELAGVVGHEIGHIAARHTAQRQTRQQVAGIGALLATVGAAALGAGGSTVKQINQLAGTAAKGYVAQFSQRQELEADQLGVQYIAKAGYNPYALADMLEHMQAQDALHARLKGQDYDPNSVGFFSSHPATAQRARQSVTLAQQSGLPINNAAPRNQDRYMAAIDGMIYGDSPDQGYARNGTFWHPSLGFAFNAPRGWEIKNTPNAVGVISPDQRALAVMDAGNKDGKTLEQLLARMLQKSKNVARPERITINGLPAVTTTAAGTIKNQPGTLRIVLIDTGAKVYRFQMMSVARDFAAKDQQFQALANSYRRISAGQAPPPLRIRTRKVYGESVANLAAQTAFDNAKEERFRVMNGLAPGQPLQSGQWVKLVQ